MYAIDSLRQLGMKYLERAELANFTFQNDILKPFVILMRSSRSESVRRLIVDCIVQVCMRDNMLFQFVGILCVFGCLYTLLGITDDKI